MATHTVAPGLRWRWTLTFENSQTDDVVASSLQSALAGVLPGVVIRAERGDPVDLTAPPPVVETLTA